MRVMSRRVPEEWELRGNSGGELADYLGGFNFKQLSSPP